MTGSADTIIQNGRIVTPETVISGDLLIKDGLISGMGGPFDTGGAEVIDARGHYVMAGGIDVHTHFNLDTGIARAQDDFYTGTVAAAMGGTTAIVDHPGFGPKGCSPFHQIAAYHNYAAGRAVVDYGFHGVLQHLDPEVLQAIPLLAAQGITSLKAYMTYDHRFTPDMLTEVMAAARAAGVMVAVHAEDHDMVQALRQKFVADKKTAAIFHALSRPARAEARAVAQAVDAARKAGNAPLYIVHLSTKDGLALVRAARAQGQPVFAETCPQYLVLDQAAYQEGGHGGLKYVMSPPLREKVDQTALKQGLMDGSVQVLATDHCPFDFELKKKLGAHDFSKCPGGAPGVEARIPLMYALCVGEMGMAVTTFSRLISENPARLMGLYPQKGVIATGSDADLIILDPDKNLTITHGRLHENVDHTPYEGMRVSGWPWLTMVRGRVVTEKGRLLVSPGYGRFIKRERTGPQALHNN